MKLFVAVLLVLISQRQILYAQRDTTYCNDLTAASKEKFFIATQPETIPPAFKNLYEATLVDWGQQVSKFHEVPLTNITYPIFRSITLGPFRDPADVRIVTIEKQDTSVLVTVKSISNRKRPRIIVHRKHVRSETWDAFMVLAGKHFISEPMHQESGGAVHDGSVTIYEGNVSGEYRFLERHVMHLNDPELLAIDRFLTQQVGQFVDLECDVVYKHKTKKKLR